MARPQSARPPLLSLASWAVFSLFTACGGEGGGGTTPTQIDPPRATSITLSTSSISLAAIGAVQQLSATVKDQTGKIMSGASVIWSSSNPAVATVSGAGSVAAVSVGVATISAKAGTAISTASVSVTQIVSAVAITAPTETVNTLGETVQYAAEVRDANGHAIPGAPVLWSSSDPDCVQIDEATGLATAVGFGAVSITATSGTVSSFSPLSVIQILSSESDLLSFSFSQEKNPTLPADATGEIDAGDVVLLISRSVDATQLIPTFTISPGARVEIDGVEQIDGVTEGDFTGVLRYVVVAEDESQTTYNVYVGRLLEAGEVLGWQRDAGWFRFISDPRDIKLLETTRIHLDSVFTRIADTLHATLTDTITVDVYPTKTSFHDKMREMGRDPQEWWIGTAPRSDWFLVVSANAPDHNMTLAQFLSYVTHEGTHSIVKSIPRPAGVGVPTWLNEGLAVLEKDLVADCFPDCAYDWEWHKEHLASVGKPSLNGMFTDPNAGYAFCFTTVIFIIKRFGWEALQTFLTDPSDYSVFGMAGSNEFETQWHAFLDHLFGLLEPAESIASARARGSGPATVEGTVTWQTQWDDRIYFLQDETAGISTFHTDGAIPLSEGDRIRISGQIASFRGETQVNTITEITVSEHGVPPATRVVTGAQINGGEFQGELVEVEGTVQAIQLLSYDNQRVTIRDSSGTEFPVYVDARTGMVAGDWPAAGTAVKVRGVLGTDDRSGVPEGTGPRVEVRGKADVTTLSQGSGSELLTISFLQSENPTLPADALGQVEGEDAVLLIPRGIDAGNLVSTFSTSPGATVRIGGVQQISGNTQNDFTAVVRYTVIAEDQSETTYRIFVGRLLEAGEVIGWQRDAGPFHFISDPRDIKLMEEIWLNLDSTFARIADTLHATVTDTISVNVYPSKAAWDDKVIEFGWVPSDWGTGSSVGSDWIGVVSSNSPDYNMSLANLLSLVSHESTHSIIASFGTPVPIWLNEGIAGLEREIIGECFPDCPRTWNYQKGIVASTGKPDLETMFDDPAVGYAFCYTTVIFIIKKYGWTALQTFLTAPTDFSAFGLADSDAFEAAWHEFLDELLG